MISSGDDHVADIPRRTFLEWGIKGGIVAVAAPLVLNRVLSSGALAGSVSPVVPLEPALLDKVLRKALSKGGMFAEIYYEHRISRDILMEENRFKSAVYGISQGAGVRVLSGDKTGYAYTDEVTEARLLRAAEVAGAVARDTRAAPPWDVREEKRPSHVSARIPLGGVADERRVDIIRRAHDAALAYDPRIKMASVSYYDEIRHRTIANSLGLLVRSELPLVFFIVQALGVGNGTSHMGRERFSRRAGLEMFDEVSPESIARASAREAVAMLAAKDAPAGRMSVVMENGWGGVLVHEAVGHPLEADNISRKTGVFVGKLGERVANPIFTMVDDGTLSNFRGTMDFDDEGIQMRRNVLIQDGVLQKFMSHGLSGRQIGMPMTGNGRRESFRHIPIPRMTNTFIENGRDNPADILASTKSGLYVQSLSGGSVNTTTGVFNFTCRQAYLIENGKKTEPVRGATLIGSCLDIIRGIDAIGDNLAFGPGICGKSGQSAEVTAGQPTVRLRGIIVGGTKAAG